MGSGRWTLCLCSCRPIQLYEYFLEAVAWIAGLNADFWVPWGAAVLVCKMVATSRFLGYCMEAM